MNCTETYVEITSHLNIAQWVEEICEFLSICQDYIPNPNVIMEVGCGVGGNLCMMSRVLGCSTTVGVSMEPIFMDIVESLIPSVDLIFIEGRSQDQDTIDRVTNALDGRTVDVLFIDGDHTAGVVKADYKNYTKFLSKPGIVGLHDLGLMPVGKFLEEVSHAEETKEIFWDHTNTWHILNKGIGTPIPPVQWEPRGIGVVFL